MIIYPKMRKSVVEHFLMKSNRDLSKFPNDTHYVVYRSGEFEVDEIPLVDDDGDIKLHPDTMISLMESVEDDLPEQFYDDDDFKDEFYNNLEDSWFVISGGIEIEDKPFG